MVWIGEDFPSPSRVLSIQDEALLGAPRGLLEGRVRFKESRIFHERYRLGGLLT